jgi:acyl carrier protein
VPTDGQTPPMGQPAIPGDVIQVMSGFQDLMRRFLDTQKSVMQTFLQGYADGAVPGAEPQSDLSHPHTQGAAAMPLLSAQPPQAAVSEAAQAISAPPVPGRPAPHNGTHLPQVAVPEAVLEEQQPAIALPAPVESARSSLVPQSGAPLPALPAIPDREELTARLIAIVSERTGYPPEMLDLDLDLEADLGIDSIKRIEILGNYQKSFDFTADDDIAVIMEELAKIKTLRGVAEWVDTRLRAVMAGQAGAVEVQAKTTEHLDADAWREHQPLMLPEASAELEAFIEEKDEGVVQRCTLTSVEQPLLEGSEVKALAPGRVMVLTDDERGIAQSLAGALQERGHAFALVRLDERVETPKPGQ